MPNSNSNVPSIVAEPWLRVARIVRPQGHRGAVIAELLTDFPERFKKNPKVSLRAPGAAEPGRAATIVNARMHQGRIVFTFAECLSMNDAETLRGYEVVIPWEARTALAEDEVYIAELVGCSLMDTRTDRIVGVVRDVDRETSNSALLVVDGVDGVEVLVPFAKAYAPAWDLAERVLRMHLPDGLLELAAAPAAEGTAADGVADDGAEANSVPAAKKKKRRAKS